MDGTPEVSRAMLRKVTIRLAHPGARDNYLSLAANANLDPDRIVELAENSFRASG